MGDGLDLFARSLNPGIEDKAKCTSAKYRITTFKHLR